VFHHRIGGPAPEPQTISVTGSAPLGVVAHIPDAPWLSTPSGLSGVTPLPLLLVANPAGLASGTYRGRVVVSGNAAQGALTIPVTLHVSGDRIGLLEARTARSLTAHACGAPTWASYFTFRDDRVVFWYALAGLQPGDRFHTEWLAPAGFVFARSVDTLVAQAGDHCGSEELAIAGRPPATIYGSWQARLMANGRELASVAFIVSRVTVESWTLNTSAADPSSCAGGAPTTNFTFNDPRVTAWLKVSGASQGDRYQVDWRAPDGSIFHTQFFPALSSGGGACLAASLPLQGAGQAVGLGKGRWTVTGYWNGAVVAAQQFELR
jgi:hypothetical protein